MQPITRRLQFSRLRPGDEEVASELFATTSRVLEKGDTRSGLDF